MKVKVLVVLLFFVQFSICAQTVAIKSEGKIHTYNDDEELLPNALILVTKDKDTIEVVTVDSLGRYAWSIDGLPGEKYTLTAKCTYFEEQSIELTVPGYENHFKIDFALKEIRIHDPNCAVFEEGVADLFTGFDVNLFKHGLRKFEHFCIQFSHVSYDQVSDELVEKRMQSFKQYLITNQVDITNFSFGRENIEGSGEWTNCQDAIQGVLISLEQKCD